MPRRIKPLSGCIGALFIYLLFCLQHGYAQVRVTGLVADAETHTGVPGVTIINKSSHTGTITEENGSFAIDAMPGDTLQFSILTYNTKAVPVPASSMFINVYLSKKIFNLGSVTVQGKSYTADSIATREEYARYFNYHKPGAKDVLKTLPSQPITALTYLVPSKARKRKEHFQEQLVYWEKEKYVDNRYSEEMVERLTKLNGDELDSFMVRYRPGYQFMKEATDYDLMLYIKQSYEQYKKEKASMPPVPAAPAKKEDEEQ
jgi:hypothetical protein